MTPVAATWPASFVSESSSVLVVQHPDRADHGSCDQDPVDIGPGGERRAQRRKLVRHQYGNCEPAEQRDAPKPAVATSVYVPVTRAGHRTPSDGDHSCDRGQQQAAYRGEAADERVLQTGMHLVSSGTPLGGVGRTGYQQVGAAPRYRFELGCGPIARTGDPTRCQLRTQATTRRGNRSHCIDAHGPSRSTRRHARS